MITCNFEKDIYTIKEGIYEVKNNLIISHGKLSGKFIKNDIIKIVNTTAKAKFTLDTKTVSHIYKYDIVSNTWQPFITNTQNFVAYDICEELIKKLANNIKFISKTEKIKTFKNKIEKLKKSNEISFCSKKDAIKFLKKLEPNKKIKIIIE